jgi:hypothetical protein
VVSPVSWWERAACVGRDPRWWDTGEGLSADDGRARLVCASCPVVSQCRAAVDVMERGLASTALQGVWAGEGPAQRMRRRRERPRPACRECGRAMRGRDEGAESAPGTVILAADGLCYRCYRVSRARGLAGAGGLTRCLGCGRVLVPRSLPAGERPAGAVVHQSRGLCSACYKAVREGRDPGSVRPLQAVPDVCVGCGRPLVRRTAPRAERPRGTVEHAGHGKCVNCYARERYHHRHPGAGRHFSVPSNRVPA